MSHIATRLNLFESGGRDTSGFASLCVTTPGQGEELRRGGGGFLRGMVWLALICRDDLIDLVDRIDEWVGSIRGWLFLPPHRGGLQKSVGYRQGGWFGLRWLVYPFARSSPALAFVVVADWSWPGPASSHFV